ncbi:ATP-dependent helicase [Calycomorphotria hydatis]|uniref:DNA 3'-5' helicase n=1 Tax=Calycomorphotria hydatis TaxID=2528027 RepID=A0A517TAX7_9PLAN|nr:ATP-dependent helicase [Calycomorphotria hydatis]QDT65520.1 ATP-dependent DNA helicase UvrD1 [Calycomorphotria hydatis]
MPDGANQFSKLLQGLNEEQRSAVLHGLGSAPAECSPLLIIAGAGTGKTTTLTRRVAALIASGVDPARILLLTFTRRAAMEMLHRVEAALAKLQGAEASPMFQQVGRAVVGGTFHAVAARLLRQYGNAIGLSPDFTVIDRSDAEDVMHAVRAELELAKQNPKFPKKGTCLNIYSSVINTGARLSELLEEDHPQLLDDLDRLRALFQSYRERKLAEAILDYDDLLLYWDQLLAEPSVGPAVRERFDHVLVDEYQDTNTLQASILSQLCPHGNGLTVVGDDAQAIYAFRGATVRNILDFPQSHRDTTVIPLELNYRSRQPILDLANAVIQGASERLEKTLRANKVEGPKPWLVRARDETEQATFIADEVLELVEQGTELSEQAILFRSSFHSLALELELNRRGIPFHKYGGLKFIETAHVKDLIAFLRMAENPKDTLSVRRVLTMLPGIGDKAATKLTAQLIDANYDFNVWEDHTPAAATREYWSDFTQLINKLTGPWAKRASIEEQVRTVRLFYDRLIELLHDHADTRRRDLEQLEFISARASDRTSFLTEMTLDPPTSTRELSGQPGSNEDEDHLTLSTIHSAKGLEFDAIYVLQVTDGSIPSEMSLGTQEELDEERRLLYVALTRARLHLYVMHPLRQYTKRRGFNDAYGYTPLSRFLPKKLLPLLNERQAGPQEDTELSPHITGKANIQQSVGKRLDDMFQ